MSSKHTIIYAEDDMDDVFMVQQAFEPLAHIEVVHAANGSEALRLIGEMLENNRRPCLVILDINMPVMNGKEALMRIREQPALAEVPVVMFSTSSSPLDKEFADTWNIELLTKPIHYSELETMARQFADKCNYEING